MSKHITLLFLLPLCVGISSVHARLNDASRFSVFGEVRKSGTYSIEGQPSLLKLLTLAGGPSEHAGKRILIIRQGDEDTNYQVISTNLVDLLKGQDTLLELGDAVYIPAVHDIYVTGEVNAPGSFRFQKGMTLRRIISLARGVKSAAQLNCVIYRDNYVTGKREKVRVDISSVLSGKAEDMPLKPNDLIVVGVVKQMMPKIYDIPPAESPPIGGAFNARVDRARERHWWNDKNLDSRAPVEHVVRLLVDF